MLLSHWNARPSIGSGPNTEDLYAPGRKSKQWERDRTYCCYRATPSAALLDIVML